MRISFTSVRRDGIIRAVAICKSVLPDNIIYIYMYLYVYTFMYTHVYEHIIRCNQRYALSSSSSSSFTLMLFVPDERNFLSSIQITRIYTHNDGTINQNEERDLICMVIIRRGCAEYKTLCNTRIREKRTYLDLWNQFQIIRDSIIWDMKIVYDCVSIFFYPLKNCN